MVQPKKEKQQTTTTKQNTKKTANASEVVTCEGKKILVVQGGKTRCGEAEN